MQLETARELSGIRTRGTASNERALDGDVKVDLAGHLGVIDAERFDFGDATCPALGSGSGMSL